MGWAIIYYTYIHTLASNASQITQELFGGIFFFFLVLNGPTTLEIKFDFLLIGKEKKTHKNDRQTDRMPKRKDVKSAEKTI